MLTGWIHSLKVGFETFVFVTSLVIPRAGMKIHPHVSPGRINIWDTRCVSEGTTITSQFFVVWCQAISYFHKVLPSTSTIILIPCNWDGEIFKCQFYSFASRNGDCPNAGSVTGVRNGEIRAKKCTRGAAKPWYISLQKRWTAYSRGFFCTEKLMTDNFKKSKKETQWKIAYIFIY